MVTETQFYYNTEQTETAVVQETNADEGLDFDYANFDFSEDKTDPDIRPPDPTKKMSLLHDDDNNTSGSAQYHVRQKRTI